MDRQGHINWGYWSFDYIVADTEGLTLRNGFFRGRRIFFKLSLPVIRVKYAGNCGPFNDQIGWHNVIKTTCDDHVCVKSFNQEGTSWLEIGVYARIGSYHIYQVYLLNNKGMIAPQVYSKGLQCNLDHWHHPYWRFDLDLDEAGHQRVNVYDGYNWKGFVDLEGKFNNSMFPNTRYNIENLRTGLRVWVFPPQLNPQQGIVGSDEFSVLDVYVRKYRSEEDRNWPHPRYQDLYFPFNENPDNSDIVFWYAGHLFHRAGEGHDHWHSIGPLLWVQLPQQVETVPQERRRVNVKGHIHIKDFALVGHDEWGHFEFNETVYLNPDASYAEIVVRRGPTGDVTAELILRIHWNPDNSVAVDFTAKLDDEGEIVSSVGAHFNVLRNTSLPWSGVHLVDYHDWDPDTCDMDFAVTNDQA